MMTEEQIKSWRIWITDTSVWPQTGMKIRKPSERFCPCKNRGISK